MSPVAKLARSSSGGQSGAAAVAAAAAATSGPSDGDTRPPPARLVRSGSAHEPALVEIGIADPVCVFGLLLGFMYVGTVTLDDDNCVPLLALASAFGVVELRDDIANYVRASITVENAVVLLHKALAFDVEQVASKALDTIAKNFNRLASSSLISLPFATVEKILFHPRLAAKSEHVVYLVVDRYVRELRRLADEQSDRSAEVPHREHAERLFEAVRFAFMPVQQLEEVARNALVPRELLLEAALVRLRRAELGEDPAGREPDCERLRPRMAYGLHFDYQQDFDCNGVLYYIGTGGGAHEHRNPAIPVAGIDFIPVKVSASSIQKGTPLLVLARDEESHQFWTANVPASWFCVDLGEARAVLPTHYTLRHGGRYKSDSLRNWEFQGSNDGVSWVDLRRHQDDRSLNGDFAACSWPVPGVIKPFRYLRILQSGRNSSNHHFLALSGFEVYGVLYGPV